MNKLYCCILGFMLLLNASTVFAQNWAPISITGQTNYRMHQPDSLTWSVHSVTSFLQEQMPAPFRTIKVDSIQQVNGLNNYFFNAVSFISGGDIHALQPNFLERKMVDAGAGVYHFYNPDSLTIHTQAQVNDSWLFNRHSQNTATVTNIIQDSVLGQIDSIKVISLSLGDSILLSKNHGIVYFSDSAGVYYTLAGIEYTPTTFIGIQMPNTSNIYTYEVDDVLVFKTLSSDYHGNSSNMLVKYTVVSKSGTNYVFQRDFYKKMQNSSGQTITTSVTTTSVVPYYSNEESIANGELFTFPFGYGLGVITEDSLGRLYKLIVYPRINNYNAVPGSYQLLNIEPNRVFTPGLGAVYYSTSNPQSSREEMLVASIKDGVLVGDTATISLVPIRKIETLPLEMSIFPQPVDAFVHIELESKGMDLGTGTVALFNLEGKLVHQEAYVGGNYLNFNIAKVAQGIYILKITTDTIHAAKKIVIARR